MTGNGKGEPWLPERAWAKGIAEVVPWGMVFVGEALVMAEVKGSPLPAHTSGNQSHRQRQTLAFQNTLSKSTLSVPS